MDENHHKGKIQSMFAPFAPLFDITRGTGDDKTVPTHALLYAEHLTDVCVCMQLSESY